MEISWQEATATKDATFIQTAITELEITPHTILKKSSTIANTTGLPSIIYLSDTEVSDRYLIHVNPMVFAN